MKRKKRKQQHRISSIFNSFFCYRRIRKIECEKWRITHETQQTAHNEISLAESEINLNCKVFLTTNANQ